MAECCAILLHATEVLGPSGSSCAKLLLLLHITGQRTQSEPAFCGSGEGDAGRAYRVAPCALKARVL
jgi:hypothetical protein